MERICPHCGKSSNSVPFVGERCAPCALDRTRKDWPGEMELKQCPTCKRIYKEREWKHLDAKAIAGLAERPFLKLGLIGHYNVEASQWEGIFDERGGKIAYTHPFVIDYTEHMCPNCGRIGSSYHEAIIQLRGDPTRVERAKKRIIRRLERRTFLQEVTPMHGGVDIQVGEKRDVPDMLRFEGHKFVRTEKLVGEKNGKPLLRSTFLIRLEKIDDKAGKEEITESSDEKE